eukprot:6193027-Pleurochrysis_carterae.AAC.2
MSRTIRTSAPQCSADLMHTLACSSQKRHRVTCVSRQGRATSAPHDLTSSMPEQRVPPVAMRSSINSTCLHGGE